jgi:ribonucleotide reductase alpha subunit
MKEKCRMQLSENARKVLQARYLRRDAQGKVSETPDQLFARVARAIAHAELLLGNREQSALWRFHKLLTSLDFLPNSPVTSIAPKGTISIIAGTTSVIEPLFALSYRRVGVLGGQTLAEFNPLLLNFGQHLGFLTPEVLEYVADYGTLAGAAQVSESVRHLFALRSKSHHGSTCSSRQPFNPASIMRFPRRLISRLKPHPSSWPRSTAKPTISDSRALLSIVTAA